MSKSIKKEIREIRFVDQQIKRRKWLESDDKKLEKMYKDCVGISEMSVRLHRTENAVNQRIKTLHLSVPKVTSKNGTPEERKQQADAIQRKEIKK